MITIDLNVYKFETIGKECEEAAVLVKIYQVNAVSDALDINSTGKCSQIIKRVNIQVLTGVRQKKAFPLGAVC